MTDRCLYDLRAEGTRAHTASSFTQIETAHAMARALLREHAPGETTDGDTATEASADTTAYVGPNRDRLTLSHHAGGSATVQLMLVDLDVETIAAVAEIAQALGAHLVPRDGGPTVPAEAAAVLTDVARRALARVQAQGASLYAAALALALEEPEAEAA